jgi:sarcosine/dimethylglycine N-methyltransferase
MVTTSAIASMPLYLHPDRIEQELRELGIAPGGRLSAEQLFPFDQLHYHGTEAVEAAARRLKLGPDSRVLEIGSGIGGPARYLAHTTGCRVTAVELLESLHRVAADLTQRCGLSDRITHICGDALTCELPDAAFDAAVSWCAFLHIPDRPRLASRIAHTLKPGGQLYLEDLYRRAPFSAADERDVREILFGTTLTSVEAFTADLAAAGTDLTDDWSAFARERLPAWRAGRERHIRVIGEPSYAAIEGFYSLIVRLYGTGSLGGIRLVARRA